jgi:hypothetical protein
VGRTATASGSRVGLVPAPWWRSFQFARIFASGFTQHRASPWGRRLVLLQLPIVAPMLAASALRRRVFWNGSSAIVTMAPVDDRRRSRQLWPGLLTLIIMYLPLAILVPAAMSLSGPGGLLALLALFAAVLMGGALSLAASSRPRSKESIADERLVLEEHSGTPTWILANLVRDPSAPAGVGGSRRRAVPRWADRGHGRRGEARRAVRGCRDDSSSAGKSRRLQADLIAVTPRIPPMEPLGGFVVLVGVVQIIILGRTGEKTVMVTPVIGVESTSRLVYRSFEALMSQAIGSLVNSGCLSSSPRSLESSRLTS